MPDDSGLRMRFIASALHVEIQLKQNFHCLFRFVCMYVTQNRSACLTKSYGAIPKYHQRLKIAHASIPVLKLCHTFLPFLCACLISYMLPGASQNIKVFAQTNGEKQNVPNRCKLHNDITFRLYVALLRCARFRS